MVCLHLFPLLLLIPVILWCSTHQADLGGHQRGGFTSNEPWGQLEVSLLSPLAGPLDFRIFQVLFHRVVKVFGSDIPVLEGRPQVLVLVGCRVLTVHRLEMSRSWQPLELGMLLMFH